LRASQAVIVALVGNPELVGELVLENILDELFRSSRVELQCSRSVYFLFEPLALSTGYFLALSLIFSSSDFETSMLYF